MIGSRTLAALTLHAASCATPSFECEANAACDLQAGGFCDAASHRCAYPDDACTGSARFSSFAGGTAEACVSASPHDHATVVAQRISVPVVIDGDPTELQIGPPLVLSSAFGVRGEVWFRFDEAGLYVGAVVTDPQLEATKVLEDELWLEDGIEFMVDTAHDREHGTLPRSDDYKFIVTALNARGTAWGGVRPHHAWDAEIESAVVVDGTMNQTTDADRGYTVELRIPWRVGLVAPEVGVGWGLNVKINDRYAGQTRSSIWRPDGGFNNPADAGTLLFADGPVAVTIGDPSTPIDPAPPFVAIDLADKVVGDSGNLDPAQPIANLFDGCLDTAPRCAAGTEAQRFSVRFDLGQVHELHSARLFGDTRHDWTSRFVSVRHRPTAEAAWVDAGRVPAQRDAWIVADLAGARARFVEVEVEGADRGVEARELQLYARLPTDMR
jgi:hypothetical protein